MDMRKSEAAQAALTAYTTGISGGQGASLGEQITDLIADLLLFAGESGIDNPVTLADSATFHFQYEATPGL